MAEVSSFLFYRLVFVPNETTVEHKLVIFKIGNSVYAEVDFSIFLQVAIVEPDNVVFRISLRNREPLQSWLVIESAMKTYLFALILLSADNDCSASCWVDVVSDNRGFNVAYSFIVVNRGGS